MPGSGLRKERPNELLQTADDDVLRFHKPDNVFAVNFQECLRLVGQFEGFLAMAIGGEAILRGKTGAASLFLLSATTPCKERAPHPIQG